MKVMRPLCHAFWIRLGTLCFGVQVLSASEGIPYPIAGPEYVVERVAALPQVTIRAIVQTRDGYLWIGTYKGLIRFDGVRSVTFNLANTPGLSSDGVYVLHEDRSGDLWIGTDDGGVIRYRGGEFRAFGAEHGLSESEVRVICEDSKGMLWLGTRRGLFYWAKNHFALFETTNLPATAKIMTLVAAPDGSLWVGTSKGLIRLREGKTEPVPELANRNVDGLAMDPNGVLWVAMDSEKNVRIMPEPAGAQVQEHPFRFGWYQRGRAGTFWLAAYTGPTRSLAGTLLRLEGLTNMSVMAKFEHRKLMSLCEDFEGNTWVGLESHGMFRVRRKQVRTISTDDGLPINAVTTILEDGNGSIWLGTFGKGLFAAEYGTEKFRPVLIPKAANVTALLRRTDGSVSVGTYNGTRYSGDGTNFVARDGVGCRVIYEDRERGLWVGTLLDGVEHHRNGQVSRYTAREGLASDRIESLVQDPGGDMWIGTLRGLNRISAGKVIRFPGEEALTRQTIRALHVDKRGALWVGTLGCGLLRLYKNQIQALTARHGLPSDAVEQILEDDEGDFWLGTWAGIVRVSRDELDGCADGRQDFVRAMMIGSEDGMPTPACGSGFQPSCMKSLSGTLWFCTPGGLVIVDPKAVKPGRQPPPVYIEEASADDGTLAFYRASEPSAQVSSHAGPMQTVRVPPGVRRLNFRYTAPSFSAPEKTRFQYRLEGFDDAWVSAGVAREATYTRLPPGSYQFHVNAMNKDGVWNTAGAVLGVIVVPPWWQRWWFRGLAIAGLAGGLFGVYELRIHQHKKARTAQELFARRLIESQEQERKRVAGELHDSLGQSLQVIRGRAQLGLTRTANAAECAKEFEEISTAASQAIQEVRTISHALRPAELDQLGLSKAIEWMVEKAGATSATRFACELDAVRPSPEIEISLYRIAQEGIHNVLKHAGATETILELKREAGCIRLSIFDNGRGCSKPVSPDGQGLVGIAERVRLLGGKFDIQSAPGKGTRLTVTIPA